MVLARKTQSFTGHTIDTLQAFADRLGFWPRLVFDRGFGNESIVTHLAVEGATFYIRVKAGRYVEFDNQRIELKDLGKRDNTVQLFGLTLRVIRTPKSRRHPEPWYILTNDQTSTRTRITKIYYHRFELKRTTLNNPNSLKVLLWFVSLGIALLYLVTKPTMHQEHYRHPKKRRSWIRIAQEQLQQAYGLLLWDEGEGGK